MSIELYRKEIIEKIILNEYSTFRQFPVLISIKNNVYILNEDKTIQEVINPMMNFSKDYDEAVRRKATLNDWQDLYASVMRRCFRNAEKYRRDIREVEDVLIFLLKLQKGIDDNSIIDFTFRDVIDCIDKFLESFGYNLIEYTPESFSPRRQHYNLTIGSTTKSGYFFDNEITFDIFLSFLKNNL